MARNPLYIVATPRSGTTLIQKLLNQTGLFDPIVTEWFNSQPYFDFTPWPEGNPPPRNCKLFPWHLAERFGTLSLDMIEAMWPDVKYVQIKRDDMDAQTASLVYSNHTGIWNTADEQRIKEYKNCGFNASKEYIVRTAIFLRRQAEAVAEMLGSRERLVFDYEEISDDPIGVTQQILRWCNGSGVDSGIFDMATTTKKLPDAGKAKLAAKIKRWRKEWQE